MKQSEIYHEMKVGYGTEPTNEEIMLANSDEDYEPYCQRCSSCGDSGCCDSLMCVYRHLVLDRDSDCKYGEYNYRDIKFKVRMFEDMWEAISKSDNSELHLAVDLLWNKVYSEVYVNGDKDEK